MHADHAPIENERVWYVRTVDLNTITCDTQFLIRQGYFASPAKGSTGRIRIVDDMQTIGTVKRPRNSAGRPQVERQIDFELGNAFYENICRHRLSKYRLVIGHWELDVFLSPLQGIYMLEWELTPGFMEVPELPSCVKEAEEVTGLIGNYDLARLATKLAKKSGDPCTEVERLIARRSAHRG